MNAEVRQIRTAAEQSLAAAFATARNGLPGGRFFEEQRESAFRRFEALGLPHRRIEEWKYTDLRTLMRDVKPLAGPPSKAAIAQARQAGKVLADIEARRVVFVDGAFVASLSDLDALESGVNIRSMAAALADGDAVVAHHLGKLVAVDDAAVALNTAFMGDGAVIHVAAGVTVERPVHLLFFSSGETPVSIVPRSLLVIEPGARAMVIESHEGGGETDDQVNTALELSVGDQAHVDHVKITAQGPKVLHISSLIANVGARARLNTFNFNIGGATVRNQLFLRFSGDDTVAGIRGASVLSSHQHVDTTIVVDHASKGCQSREMFKSVLDGQSRGVFQGKIIVRPGAQKTDAKMMTQALLLSEAAEADNKPELEIYADDVQCGHGATAGALDEDLLFYLRARGIPHQQAEALLIQAFVGEAIEGIEHAGLREALMEEIGAWLNRRE
jgi:Fe-S cluster assembly protein SufD